MAGSEENGNGRCPVCRGTGAAPTHREGEFRYVRCEECGLVRLDPLPTGAEQRHLHAGYLPEELDDRRAFDLMSRDVWTRARKTLTRRHGRGRLLDVGCGHGSFLAMMRAAGWEVQGLEVCASGRAAVLGRGIEVAFEAVEECSLPPESFDAVTAIYVIEHVPDPLAFLRACRRLLVPGGTLYLRYPETTPLKDLLAVLRVPNRLYHAPFHVLDFSPSAMRNALTRAGFVDPRIRVGGFTVPPTPWERTFGVLPTIAGHLIDAATGGRLLLPGVSKTAIARRPPL